MNLDNLNVVELSAKEAKAIEGGFFEIFIGLVIGTIIAIGDNRGWW
jgi:hypothetical protein